MNVGDSVNFDAFIQEMADELRANVAVAASNKGGAAVKDSVWMQLSKV